MGCDPCGAHDGSMTDNTVLDQIAERAAATGVVRWHDRRVIAGVARGLGARFDIDPLVVRVGFVIATFLGGIGLVGYLLAWVLLPDDRGQVALVQATRDRSGAAVALVVIAALSVLGFVAGAGTNGGGRFLGLLVLAGIGYLFWRNSGGRRCLGGSSSAAQQAPAGTGSSGDPTAGGPAASSPAASSPTAISPTVSSPTAGGQPSGGSAPAGTRHPVVEPPPAGEPATMPVITPWGGRDGERIATYGPSTHPSAHAAAPQAARLVAAPIAAAPRRRSLGWRGWALSIGLGLISYLLARQIGLGRGLDALAAETLAWGVTAVVIGVLLVTLGGRGYSTSGVAPTAAILALLAVSVPWASSHLERGAAVGEAHWQPAAVADLQSSYDVGVGQATLDLTRLSSADLAGKNLRANVGMGELSVRVPSDVRVEVRHRVGLGEVRVRDVGGHEIVRDGAGVGGTETMGDGPTLVLDTQVGVGEARVERIAR